MPMKFFKSEKDHFSGKTFSKIENFLNTSSDNQIKRDETLLMLKFNSNQHDIDLLESDQKCYFMDFIGSPWGARNKNERLHGRMIIQTLINSLKVLGWTFLISADVSAKCIQTKDVQYPLDCHSIFLVKTSDHFFTENMTFDTPDPPSYLEALNYIMSKWLFPLSFLNTMHMTKSWRFAIFCEIFENCELNTLLNSKMLR